MSFNSYEFIFAFFPATLAGFLLLVIFGGRTAVISWLIFASIAFYAIASVRSLLVIAPAVLLDYFIALTLLNDSHRRRLRLIVFSIGITANIFTLGYFKYKNFFLDTINTTLNTNFELTQWILPLGLSFITFQKIAFLADVQSGQIKSVRFLDFLLFALFFPRTIAGPIIHYEDIVPQLTRTTWRETKTNVVVGGCLFTIGLFKKTVIADSLVSFVARTFDLPPSQSSHDLTMLTAWTGVWAYMFQLYFDFSGYSDMALGLARIFGVKFPMNFNSPLRACSVLEFWNRWHITLTRFLTAYIYTPIVLHLTRRRLAQNKPVMRGKRSSLSAIAVIVGVPTMITMTISGFWHGAGWQFIVWGALHGIYLTVNQSWRLIRPRFWPDQVSYERIMNPLGFILTVGCVTIALVFFRASSVTSGLSILGAMAARNGILPHYIQVIQQYGGNLPWDVIVLIQPISPLIWIMVLFVSVTVLPNSLELLRRFQPALDFPEEPSEVTSPQREPADPPTPYNGRTKSTTISKLHAAYSSIRDLRYEGVSLNPLTAALFGLLCFLAVAGLSRSDGFVYGQF